MISFFTHQRVYDEEVEDPAPKPETTERQPEQVPFGDVPLIISAVDHCYDFILCTILKTSLTMALSFPTISYTCKGEDKGTEGS